MITEAAQIEEIRMLLVSVVDPDIPYLTIEDIAILRNITIGVSGRVTVTITPTYSGCPAVDVIKTDILAALAGGGFDDVNIETVHKPAWTTEWLSQETRRKLAENLIAPPGSVLDIVPEILCPLCSSEETRIVSEFGSTACKSLMACTECGEPFDYFKAI